MRTLGNEEPGGGLHAPAELGIAQVDVVRDAVVPGIADVLEMGHRVPLGRMGETMQADRPARGRISAVCDLREQHKLTQRERNRLNRVSCAADTAKYTGTRGEGI